MASPRLMPTRQMRKRKLTCRTSWARPLPQSRPPGHHPAEAVPAAVGVVACAPETAGVDVGAAEAADVPVAVSMDMDMDLSARVAAAIDCKERAEVDGLHPQKRIRCLMRTRPMPSILLALRTQPRTRLLLRNARHPPRRRQSRWHQPAPLRRLPRRPGRLLRPNRLATAA